MRAMATRLMAIYADVMGHSHEANAALHLGLFNSHDLKVGRRDFAGPIGGDVVLVGQDDPVPGVGPCGVGLLVLWWTKSAV